MRKPAVSVGIALLDAALDAPVSGSVPRDRPRRFVTLYRVGGTKRNLVQDCAWLTVECWADSDAAAEELAGAALDAVEGAEGSFVTYTNNQGQRVQAWVGDVSEIAGVARNPSPDVSTSARWTFTVEVGIHTNV